MHDEDDDTEVHSPMSAAPDISISAVPGRVGERGSAPKGGVGTLRYLFILSDNSAFQVPICAVTSRSPRCPGGARGGERFQPIPRTSTRILDFRGFDSGRILISRDGILRCIGDSLEILSRQILVCGFLVCGSTVARPGPEGHRLERRDA